MNTIHKNKVEAVGRIKKIFYNETNVRLFIDSFDKKQNGWINFNVLCLEQDNLTKDIYASLKANNFNEGDTVVLTGNINKISKQNETGVILRELEHYGIKPLETKRSALEGQEIVNKSIYNPLEDKTIPWMDEMSEKDKEVIFNEL